MYPVARPVPGYICLHIHIHPVPGTGCMRIYRHISSIRYLVQAQACIQRLIRRVYGASLTHVIASVTCAACIPLADAGAEPSVHEAEERARKCGHALVSAARDFGERQRRLKV